MSRSDNKLRTYRNSNYRWMLGRFVWQSDISGYLQKRGRICLARCGQRLAAGVIADEDIADAAPGKAVLMQLTTGVIVDSLESAACYVESISR